MGSGQLALSNYELARVSIALVDVDGVTRLDNRPNVRCYAASIMKLAVAVAVLRELDRGTLSPDDHLSFDGGFFSGLDGSRFFVDDDSSDQELCSADLIGGGTELSRGGELGQTGELNRGGELGRGVRSGDAGGISTFGEAGEVFPSHWVRRESDAGLELGEAGERGAGVSVARALCRSITVSSNEGANLLMQAVGLEAINWVLLEAGCNNSVVERMVFDGPARDAGRTNTLTALDAAQLMWSIRFGTLASDASLTHLCEVLRAQTQRSMTALALSEAMGRGEVVVGNKEGQTSDVLHDVAFVEPDDTYPFVLAVCTTGMTEQAATDAVRKIATYAYENKFSAKDFHENLFS